MSNASGAGLKGAGEECGAAYWRLTQREPLYMKRWTQADLNVASLAHSIQLVSSLSGMAVYLQK